MLLNKLLPATWAAIFFQKLELKPWFAALGDPLLHPNHYIIAKQITFKSLPSVDFHHHQHHESTGKNTRPLLPEEGWGAKAKIEEGEEQAWGGGDGGGGGGGGHWGGLTSSSWVASKVEVGRTSYESFCQLVSAVCCKIGNWLNISFPRLKILI